MATVLKLGPADHGRPMTYDEFRAGDYTEGYHYELIHGKLYVAPQPNLSEDGLKEWITDKLKAYAREYPEVINHVTTGARVFLPEEAEVSAPEPDVAAYQAFPLERLFHGLNWQDVSPLLVVEVLSADDPDKDLRRNRDLYLQVPSIKEYWVFDMRGGVERLTMRIHRRSGRRWRVWDLSAGDTYTTRLLPDFNLRLDPMS
jgi:Uma2 family endonuclease